MKFAYTDSYQGVQHAMESGIAIEVTGYSGYKADERPTSFRIGDILHQITEIIDRWYGPDHSYFKVIADDGNIYILRCQLETDFWELYFFQKKSIP